MNSFGQRKIWAQILQKMRDFPLNHQLHICLRSLSFLIISVILTFNCMHVCGSLSCQTLWIFPVTNKNTVLITQYKMINLKLRFWVSQLYNLVYLVLHSAYLIIGTPFTYSYHNDASPDGRKVWKKIRRFTSVIMIHQTKRHIYTLRGNKRCRY